MISSLIRFIKIGLLMKFHISNNEIEFKKNPVKKIYDFPQLRINGKLRHVFK